VLKIFLEQMLSMSPELKQEEMMKFQDDGFLFGPEIDAEMGRLDSIGASEEAADSFIKEMEVRMEPHLAEFSEQMGTLMENFMGGLMGGIAEAMGGASEESGSEIDYEQYYVNEDDDDHERSDMLYSLYQIISPYTLEEYRDGIFSQIEDRLQDYVWDLDAFKDYPLEECTDVVEKVEKGLSLFESEVERQCKRIAGIPDMAESAQELQKELLAKYGSKVKDLQEQVKKKKEKG
jgi:hypothetical protein